MVVNGVQLYRAAFRNPLLSKEPSGASSGGKVRKKCRRASGPLVPVNKT